MTEFAKIVPQYSVAPQLMAEDFAAADAAGFASIINLRPDREKPGYLTASEASALAKEHGLQYAHIPVPKSGPTEDLIGAFAKAIADLPGPVLAHCGTGRRAAILWAICSAGALGTDEILSCCAGAGHDLSKMRPMLEQRAAAMR